MADPDPARSRLERDRRLGDVLVKILLRNTTMSRLHDAIVDHPGDDNLAHLYVHYGMLESYDFIVALEELYQLSDGDEKLKLDAVRPILSWLLNYKDGLRKWRHNRIAHLDDLGTPSMVYYGKYTIPGTIEDFNRIYRSMFFLGHYVMDVYMSRLLISKQELLVEDQKQKEAGYVVNTNHDLATFKEQVIKNLEPMSTMFKNDKYPVHMGRLRRL